MQTIKTVADIPKKCQLVTDFQDIRATLESIGQHGKTAGCLFVAIHEGEYTNVYACERSVPWINAPVQTLLEKGVEITKLNQVPTDWTARQWQMAIWKSKHFDVPFDPQDWQNYGEYIGRKFGNMFLGIEKDGYAHS